MIGKTPCKDAEGIPKPARPFALEKTPRAGFDEAVEPTEDQVDRNALKRGAFTACAVISILIGLLAGSNGSGYRFPQNCNMKLRLRSCKEHWHGCTNNRTIEYQKETRGLRTNDYSFKPITLRGLAHALTRNYLLAAKHAALTQVFKDYANKAA